MNTIFAPGTITCRRYRISGLIASESTIDLAISNRPENINSFYIIQDSAISNEHQPTVTELNDKPTTAEIIHDQEAKWNIREKDDEKWEKYKSIMENAQVIEADSIEQGWKIFESLMNNAMKTCF